MNPRKQQMEKIVPASRYDSRRLRVRITRKETGEEGTPPSEAVAAAAPRMTCGSADFG